MKIFLINGVSVLCATAMQSCVEVTIQSGREVSLSIFVPLKTQQQPVPDLLLYLLSRKKTESDKKVDSSNKKGGGWCPQAYYFLVKLHLYSDTYQSNLFCLLCKNVGYISITYSIMLNRRPAV